MWDLFQIWRAGSALFEVALDVSSGHRQPSRWPGRGSQVYCGLPVEVRGAFSQDLCLPRQTPFLPEGTKHQDAVLCGQEQLRDFHKSILERRFQWSAHRWEGGVSKSIFFSVMFVPTSC